MILRESGIANRETADVRRESVAAGMGLCERW